jgi:hypothetical protein
VHRLLRKSMFLEVRVVAAAAGCGVELIGGSGELCWYWNRK